MTTMTIDMPVVSECGAADCAYNVNSACNARAITIGDGIHPGCDTFFMNRVHTHNAHRRAGIGACKVMGCKYNDDLECTTENITVGRDGASVSCMTFTAR